MASRPSKLNHGPLLVSAVQGSIAQHTPHIACRGPVVDVLKGAFSEHNRNWHQKMDYLAFWPTEITQNSWRKETNYEKIGPTCDQLLWNTFSAGGSDIGDVLELLGVLFVDNFLCFSRIGDSHT